jgi:serralysin
VLAQMADAGSGRAAVFTQWLMDDPTSSHLARDPSRTPTDAAITHAAAQGRPVGHTGDPKPQIGIRTGNWIGYAHPADLVSFWADYRAMLVHYADLAQQIGATTLVIGTKMQTLSWDQAPGR